METSVRTKRNTIQKTKILSYLMSVKTHPTAEMVYAAISKDLPMLTLATVYRNLHSLADQGMILRFKYKNTYRFDGNSKLHFHAACKSCGTIYDYTSKKYEKFIESEKKELAEKGFIADSYNLIFYGLCKKCNEVKK